MGWPLKAEFTDYLLASGLWQLAPTDAQKALNLNGALQAAVDRWNDMTHYWPFLSTGLSTEERRFDPDGGRLIDLNGGLITLTSLNTNLTVSDTTGNARTNIQDFRLMPADAPPRKKPWTYVQTSWTTTGDPGSIKIVGEWGYCSEANLPEAARRAVMALAAMEILPQIQMQISRGGLIKLSEGDSTKEWGFAELKKLWDGVVQSALYSGDYVRRRIA